ncbi:hypothetical protein X471_00167 [Bartonella bacilliformis str. Heidi Mejia]|nr:hypothetical protein X471_00167 [Bartonella bacilliformis str. Heidi Mejia]KEG19036.1 hypothetical protein H707_00780 [Bartonella bacilliformis Hosp800-02]KEG22237.1 hypothetical protein H708_00788 [Bartonella bacilliformis VAB9028]KEG24493.1 hypothetical protein H706_00790 [Bartonella bacilliformis CAR600-02]
MTVRPLRITQYGCNWDFLYIIKLEYIDKDTKESPESSFIFGKNIEQWNHYVNGNLGNTLTIARLLGKENVTNVVKYE